LCPHSYTTQKKKQEESLGGDPFYLKFWVKVTALERKRQLSIDICS